MTGASILHGDGIIGSGVIVAVIDSGTANSPHGTWVGSTIAANILFLFSNSSPLATAAGADDTADIFIYPIADKRIRKKWRKTV